MTKGGYPGGKPPANPGPQPRPAAWTRQRQLVIDVGMFEGSDTQQYLLQGYDVVAIEANPANVAFAKRRFPRELENGRLRILNCAVAAYDGIIHLNVPDGSPGCSTLSQGHIDRSLPARTREYRSIEVPARTFQSILADYGTPHYIKVDIEGSDMLCVNALRSLDRVPRYFSMESRVGFKGFRAVLTELRALHAVGYRRFIYVDQRWNTPLTSGPFGERLGGDWLTIGEARRAAARLHIANRIRERFNRPLLSWYDLHAAL